MGGWFPNKVQTPENTKSPWKLPFSTWISPLVFPNLTKTLGCTACPGATSYPFLAVVIFQCWNSLIDFYGLSYDGCMMCMMLYDGGNLSTFFHSWDHFWRHGGPKIPVLEINHGQGTKDILGRPRTAYGLICPIYGILRQFLAINTTQFSSTKQEKSGTPPSTTSPLNRSFRCKSFIKIISLIPTPPLTHCGVGGWVKRFEKTFQKKKVLSSC